jgi:hypothetical protein
MAAEAIGSTPAPQRFRSTLPPARPSMPTVVRMSRGPLAETIQSRLWLLLRPADQALAPLMRAATWRATAARRVVAA